MPTAFSYIRFSTPEQAIGGSRARQAAAAAEWARLHGYELDASHADLGLSAFKGSHRTGGALGRFLSAVEAGRIPSGSALIIEAIDRLSRETPSEAAEFMLRIINSGIRIVSLEDQTEYTRESIAAQQHLMYVLIGKIQQANGFSERLVMRVTHGRREARARKLAAHQPITGQCPGWLKVVSDEHGSRYVPIRERVGTIRHIFEAIASGMAKQAIANDLNNRGVPTFRTLEAKRPAAGWGTSSIFKLATNRALIGEFTPTKTEYVKDAVTKKVSVKKLPQHDQTVTDFYPIVIDPVLFNRVNSVQRPKGPKGQTFSNLLQGIPRCWHCGGRMTCRGYYKNYGREKNHRILICDNFTKYFKGVDGKPLCTSGKRMVYTSIEAFIIETAAQLVQIENVQHDDATSNIISQIATNDVDIGRAERSISNALDNLDGPASPTILKWIESKEQVIAKLKGDNITLEKKRHAAASIAGQDYRQLVRLYEQAQAETDLQRCAMTRARINTILRQTVDQLMVDPATKSITAWLGGGRMLATLLDGRTTRYAVMGSRMVRLRGDGTDMELTTPPDILAQHLALTRGERITPTDMPGVFAGVDLSAILRDPTEYGTIIEEYDISAFSSDLIPYIKEAFRHSIIQNGRIYVYAAPDE